MCSTLYFTCFVYYILSTILPELYLLLIQVGNYNFSTGNPTTGLICDARDRSSSISESVSLHPRAPTNSVACSAFLAPGMGTTLSWHTNQFRTTWREKKTWKLEHLNSTRNGELPPHSDLNPLEDLQDETVIIDVSFIISSCLYLHFPPVMCITAASLVLSD